MNDDHDPYPRIWWLIAAVVAALVLAMFVSGCMSASRAQSTSSGHLIYEHRKHMTIFEGRPNMAVVREIHARGGISDQDLAAFETKRWHLPLLNYEAMGITDADIPGARTPSGARYITTSRGGVFIGRGYATVH